MMPLRNLLYLLQLEEYDLKRFSDWLKNNPGCVVLEKKKHIDWTPKARILWALAHIFYVITLGNGPLAIKISSRFLSPIDILAKKFLVSLARFKINRMKNLTVIGITGSYGKTTTKDAISHVLIHKYKTLKTEGNYNTPLGVAKTILKNLKPEHEIFVCEMAAYQAGDIKAISKLIKPKIGIITAIGPMHLERFGSEENILKTKMELIESLPESGVGFLPKELEQKIKNFSIRSKIEFFSSKEDLLVKIGKIFDITQEEIFGYIKTAPQTLHRQQIIKTSAGITIIDDTYNSNPAGFLSALEMLKNTPAQRRILVTPGMIELGEKQFELNKEAAQSAAKIADYTIVVGETNKDAFTEGLKEVYGNDYISRVYEVLDLDAAKSKLSELTIPNSAILLENDLPDHYF
ncbi:MAG: UDP-N-acetylmuramoyl-tripeptide--D-alanyl-D-alanine ligase [Parcubacteria group bacterium]|nr:UDP-N-acetylmuramoyl-tripeptide--D-alanyl-D-alanine ligase [Parcubacteria group bacterium]